MRWAKGDIGEKCFAPWVEQLEGRGVRFLQNTKAVDFEASDDGRQISAGAKAPSPARSRLSSATTLCSRSAAAPSAPSRSPALAKSAEFRV